MVLSQSKKAYKGPAMEGMMARWYARNTGRNLEPFKKEAEAIAARLPGGGAVLEVAPGPGFLAIELAKLGAYRITGLDISKSFVQIATENARQACVAVLFREGNASTMPFDEQSFDFIYCRAAFKNFSAPVEAIAEMHRVLKPAGMAIIHDMRKDATNDAIRDEVKGMGMGWFNALMTRWILRSLRKRAYGLEEFHAMAAATSFGTCEMKTTSIGVEVLLRK